MALKPLPRALVLSALLLVVHAGLAAAVAAGEALPRGEIVPELAGLTDPGERYALYLPKSYDPARAWPVLLVLDPRGRAVESLEVFRPGAEREGFVVLSSYGSASDTPDSIERNQRAMRGLLADLPRRVTADPRRVVIAGFSGTARAAWAFALRLPQHVLGVIAAGGGLLPGFPGPAAGLAFGWYGTAGDGDFNFQEMVALDRELAALGMRHHLETFAGRHQWPPAEIATDALAWMRLQAMARGLEPPDPTWLGQARTRAEAGFASAQGDPLLLERRLASAIEGFAPFGASPEWSARLGALRASPELETARKRAARFANREASYRRALEIWRSSFTAAEEPPPLARSLAELQVEKLLKLAAGDDVAEAASARRRLAELTARTGSYLPTRYRVEGAVAREVAVLEIALAVAPGHALARLRLASALSRSGSTGRACRELERLRQEAPDLLAPENLAELFPSGLPACASPTVAAAAPS